MKIYNYCEIVSVDIVKVNGEDLQVNFTSDNHCFYSKVGYYSVGDKLKIDYQSNKVFKF